MLSIEATNISALYRCLKRYLAYSDVKWLVEAPAQDRKTLVIFQTGLTGLTGCTLCFNPVNPVILSRTKKPQMNADEHRFVAITHRKGREERKAQQQKSLYFGTGKTPRHRTRMTRIRRIFTDTLIRAHPCHPCNPCSIAFTPHRKISRQWYFSLITQQEAAR